MINNQELNINLDNAEKEVNQMYKFFPISKEDRKNVFQTQDAKKTKNN